MTNTDYTNPPGPFEARYLAFLNGNPASRHAPLLCAHDRVGDGRRRHRAGGTIEAYRKLDQFDDSRPIKPWLFRIAHNRCIDFLRRRGVRDEAEATAAVPEAVQPAEPVSLGIGRPRSGTPSSSRSLPKSEHASS